MLFNNPKGVIYGIAAFLILFVGGLALSKCHAAEGPIDAPYVQFSAGSAIVRGAAPLLDITFTEPASQLPHAFWQESMTIIGTSRYNGQDVGNNAALRGLFVDGFGHFDIGLGVAWMVNPGPYNAPDHFNFNLQADYRFQKLPITLTYTHMSDAGISHPNLGRDLLLLGWRF